MIVTSTLHRRVFLAAIAIVVGGALGLGGCSLTLETVVRHDGSAPARDVAMGADASADASVDSPFVDGQASDGARPDLISADVDIRDAVDAVHPDAPGCGDGPPCTAGNYCCELNSRCVPEACGACCMAPFDGGALDVGALDVPIDVRPDAPRDVPADVYRDVGTVPDMAFDAARDVPMSMVDAGRTDDSSVVILDMGPSCGLCSAGAICCGTSCVDTDFDENNCGGCGIACRATEVCRFGGCRGCVAGEALCIIGGDRCCPLATFLCTVRCPTGT